MLGIILISKRKLFQALASSWGTLSSHQNVDRSSILGNALFSDPVLMISLGESMGIKEGI